MRKSKKKEITILKNNMLLNINDIITLEVVIEPEDINNWPRFTMESLEEFINLGLSDSVILPMIENFKNPIIMFNITKRQVENILNEYEELKRRS